MIGTDPSGTLLICIDARPIMCPSLLLMEGCTRSEATQLALQDIAPHFW